MKKFMFLLAALTVSSVAQAKDSLDGCGLGWEVTDQKTYTATTTRSTTNAFVPPGFGMTTGTMGCEQLDIGKLDEQAADYVATNYESLKSELASGRGEYVDSLADAFGCSAQAEQMGARIQKNYSTVVAPARDSLQLYKNIRTEVANVCI